MYNLLKMAPERSGENKDLFELELATLCSQQLSEEELEEKRQEASRMLSQWESKSDALPNDQDIKDNILRLETRLEAIEHILSGNNCDDIAA